MIILSYLFEDLAIVSASVAATQNVLPVYLALLALFIGITTGDLALYFLGSWSRKWQGLRRVILTKPSFKIIKNKLKKNTFSVLFLIRFIPGLRFIGFCLSGFFHLNLKTFLSAVLLSTACWTALMFSLVYQLGEIDWIQKNISWGLIPILSIILFFFHRIAAEKLREKTRRAD